MAFLWWHSEVRHVSEALSGVNELKTVMAKALRDRGFADVRSNQWEVAGGKNGAWVSIAHLHIANREYWEMAMASGDTAATQNVLNEAVAIIEGLRFL